MVPHPSQDLGAPYPGALLPGSMGAYPATPQRLQEKLFPCMLHHNLPNIFSFGSSNFKVQKSKESTARVVGWRELGLVNSFTLEASFAGASTGKYAGASGLPLSCSTRLPPPTRIHHFHSCRSGANAGERLQRVT